MVAEELLQEVLAVVPDAPVDVIRRCLLRTKNAELTISLYMDGLLSEVRKDADPKSACTYSFALIQSVPMEKTGLRRRRFVMSKKKHPT